MDQTVSRSFAGDVAVSTPSFGAGGSGLSPKLAPAIARQPAVRYAVGLGRGVAQVNGKGRALTVTGPVTLGKVFDLGEVRGSLDDLGTDGIALTRKEAADQHLTTGDTARLTFTDGRRENFTVRAVYGRSELAGDYVITRAAWAPHRTQDSDSLVAVTFKSGVSAADGKAAVKKVAAQYGNPEVQTRDEYAQSSAGGIDMMLTLVYALLALAVLIALLGIANTLTLAIHERTRELGLLRAVGQTRAQLRAMVRWESVLVAAFGTAGGLALGAFLGWVLVEASDGASDSAFAFAIPPVRLVVVALVGLAAGALAGLRPARRAARLDVLRAIATE
jgi:putative ABC transport system permease protein